MIPNSPATVGPDDPICSDDPDPVVARWQTFFAPIDWTVLDQVRWRPPGPVPHPPSAYCKALLIKLQEGLPSIPRLRAYLLEHPALIRALGFHPRPSGSRHVTAAAPALPGERWLRHQQQCLGMALLEQLLTQTVRVVQPHAPALGTTVALDTTHLYAYVRENNPNNAPAHPFARGHQPRGDHDCALGAKVRGNQSGRARKTWLFGYGCGFAVSPISGAALVVAAYTQPVNRQDITYAAPLLAQCCTTLGRGPEQLTADAAFDAWSLYEAVPGLVAIAPNRRGPAPPRSPDGHPLCAAGHVMRPTCQGRHEDGYQVQHYGCPLRGTDASCTDPRFARGGCRKRCNIEPGGVRRATLDRTEPAYQALYRQRTCVERCFSQAKALGLERPNVRTRAAVERLVALTAILLNLRTIARHFPHLAHPYPT